MRESIIQTIEKEKIIVIVRGVDKEKLIPLAEAMYKGGIRLLELTYSANGKISDEETAENIGMLAEHFAGRMYIGAGTVLTEKQVEGLTERLTSRVEFLEENDCELVYLIVPNPITIYPETAPIRYPKSTADTSRTEQFLAAAKEAGATVIELEDLLYAHREERQPMVTDGCGAHEAQG